MTLSSENEGHTLHGFCDPNVLPQSLSQCCLPILVTTRHRTCRLHYKSETRSRNAHNHLQVIMSTRSLRKLHKSVELCRKPFDHTTLRDPISNLETCEFFNDQHTLYETNIVIESYGMPQNRYLCMGALRPEEANTHDRMFLGLSSPEGCQIEVSQKNMGPR